MNVEMVNEIIEVIEKSNDESFLDISYNMKNRHMENKRLEELLKNIREADDEISIYLQNFKNSVTGK